MGECEFSLCKTMQESQSKWSLSETNTSQWPRTMTCCCKTMWKFALLCFTAMFSEDHCSCCNICFTAMFLWKTLLILRLLQILYRDVFVKNTAHFATFANSSQKPLQTRLDILHLYTMNNFRYHDISFEHGVISTGLLEFEPSCWILSYLQQPNEYICSDSNFGKIIIYL